MLLASLSNVTKHYGTQTVLDGATLQIASGQKLGLVGPNGSGKTTLLRILLGLEPPSDGTATLARGIRVGYVPQHVDYDEDETVLECVLASHARLAAALREQEDRLAHAAPDAMDKALRAYQRARDAYDRADGVHLPRRAEAMLDALGLAGRAGQRLGSLSGGERNVVALTRALLDDPELLVLDEPANHLDYLGVAWLEDFLARLKGAVLVVSHNRYLLDRVVGGILELGHGRVRYYDGGYSAYRATRLRELLAQQADYSANQKRLAQLETLVKRFAEIARRTTDPAWGKRLRARRSQLQRERGQAVQRPELGAGAIKADFSTEATRANIALQLRGYSKAFGQLALFDDADLDVACGERVALVGPNGCGKTTLLRDIIEQGSWDHSAIRIGPSLTVGYCAQEQELLDDERSVVDEILAAQRMTRKQASGLLARFLFSWDDLGKRVSDLSGGERNRLQLARLVAIRPNFLILDEPTNHLDIPAREAIEEALADFEGTLLVVSHDRYFLDKIATRVVEVRDRSLVPYSGNFTDFWFARQAMASGAVGRVTKRGKARKPSGAKQAKGAVAELERRINAAERQKVDLERRVAEAFAARDQSAGRRATRQLERLAAQLDDLYDRWLAEGS